MQVGAIPAPVHPPAVYLADDWMLQTYYPALFYDISGEGPNTVVNATNPVGLIWKVEPLNSAEVLYYPTVSSHYYMCFHYSCTVNNCCKHSL